MSVACSSLAVPLFNYIGTVLVIKLLFVLSDFCDHDDFSRRFDAHPLQIAVDGTALSSVESEAAASYSLGSISDRPGLATRGPIHWKLKASRLAPNRSPEASACFDVIWFPNNADTSVIDSVYLGLFDWRPTASAKLPKYVGC